MINKYVIQDSLQLMTFGLFNPGRVIGTWAS